MVFSTGTRAPSPSSSTTGDLIADHRTRLAQEQRVADERRRAALAEQCSELRTADERIRIWEKLHELRMPRDAKHPLVDVIAADTQLASSEVRSVQRYRMETQKPADPEAGRSWNAGPIR